MPRADLTLRKSPNLTLRNSSFALDHTVPCRSLTLRASCRHSQSQSYILYKKNIYFDCSSQLVECHWHHTLGKLHTQNITKPNHRKTMCNWIIYTYTHIYIYHNDTFPNPFSFIFPILFLFPSFPFPFLFLSFSFPLPNHFPFPSLVLASFCKSMGSDRPPPDTQISGTKRRH